MLYDDRDERAGAKFATMDLIGIPYQLIVGPKGVKSGEIEIKVRNGGARKSVPLDAAVTEVGRRNRSASAPGMNLAGSRDRRRRA